MSDRPEEPDAIVVLSTTDGEEPARKIAKELVERRLAACVNIVPRVHSIYRWRGKVTQDDETMLIIKSRRPLFEKIREAIRELHTYDVPEVISFDIARGDAEFLGWIRESTARS